MITTCHRFNISSRHQVSRSHHRCRRRRRWINRKGRRQGSEGGSMGQHCRQGDDPSDIAACHFHSEVSGRCVLAF
jgi:ribosomal protein L44E